jgi:hypothetical protein
VDPVAAEAERDDDARSVRVDGRAQRRLDGVVHHGQAQRDDTVVGDRLALEALDDLPGGVGGVDAERLERGDEDGLGISGAAGQGAGASDATRARREREPEGDEAATRRPWTPCTGRRRLAAAAKAPRPRATA